jgi:hypothetical protein
MLSRSAMVLSSVRAAQDMEAGSSSFPGVGASVRAPIRRAPVLSLRRIGVTRFSPASLLLQPGPPDRVISDTPNLSGCRFHEVAADY